MPPLTSSCGSYLFLDTMDCSCLPIVDPVQDLTGARKDQRRRQTCLVTFNLLPCHVDVGRICPIDCWDTSEIEGLWMQKHDYERIRQEGLAVLSRMATGGTWATKRSDDCFRGLESCTKSGAIHKHQIRKAALHAVLFEQGLQRERGVTDPKRIAMVYRQYSRDSKENASLRGLHDEKQAVQEENEILLRRHAPTKNSSTLFDRPPNQVTRCISFTNIA